MCADLHMVSTFYICAKMAQECFFLRNHCNILGVNGDIHSKNRGKTASCAKRMMLVPQSTQKNVTTIPYHFILTLLNTFLDFDVSVTNDVAIDVAKCALPGKVMQGSPCLEAHALTNENWRYMMKLNDWHMNAIKYM